MPNASDFNRFTVNPLNIDINRSMFDMEHSVKWSANVGECIPFDCIEILPGDTVKIDTSKVIRLQPLVAPIFDEVILDVYWFFCPNRLVWSHWKEFMGENNNSAWTPSVEYNIPKLTPPQDPSNDSSYAKCWNVGTIADYMGVPVGHYTRSPSTALATEVYANSEISALPFRAYALICDQWFRSEAVMDPVHVHVDDTNRVGVNTGDQVTDIELGGKPFIACKFFDYFTSALPSPQRGDPVSISVASGQTQNVPLKFGREDISPYRTGASVTEPGMHIGFNTDANRTIRDSSANFALAHSGTSQYVKVGSSTSPSEDTHLFINNAYVTLPDTASYITINDLRTAFAIQRYLEKQARFGGRYIEYIKGFFGVDSPDARLQRTEYLGGSRVSLNISQVENQTNTSSNTTPIGSVAGMSVTADQHSDVDKSFTEHGYLIGIAVARYHHSYQDSLHKMFTRFDPYEFYNPTFANLGEQKVMKNQLHAYHSVDSGTDSTFGYQEAWAEYRYMPDRVCGELRSVYETPLDMWHLGDHYSSTPSLSPEWLREDKSNLDRCLAVTSDVSNQYIADFYIEMKMTRVMPMYSIPGLIDHH